MENFILVLIEYWKLGLEIRASLMRRDDGFDLLKIFTSELWSRLVLELSQTKLGRLLCILQFINPLFPGYFLVTNTSFVISMPCTCNQLSIVTNTLESKLTWFRSSWFHSLFQQPCHLFSVRHVAGKIKQNECHHLMDVHFYWLRCIGFKQPVWASRYMELMLASSCLCLPCSLSSMRMQHLVVWPFKLIFLDFFSIQGELEICQVTI